MCERAEGARRQTYQRSVLTYGLKSGAGCKAGAAFSESDASPRGCRDLVCELPKMPQINALNTSETATRSKRSRTMMSSLSLLQWGNKPNVPRRA